MGTNYKVTKAYRVIESCETFDQLVVAQKYVYLLTKDIRYSCFNNSFKLLLDNKLMVLRGV